MLPARVVVIDGESEEHLVAVKLDMRTRTRAHTNTYTRTDGALFRASYLAVVLLDAFHQRPVARDPAARPGRS